MAGLVLRRHFLYVWRYYGIKIALHMLVSRETNLLDFLVKNKYMQF